MQERISPDTFYTLQPALPKALISLGEAAVASGLEPGLIHLVKMRVSQINGCAFCQHMHANEARKDGEQQSRLDILAAWYEAPGFSERERAALAWSESLTLLAQSAVDDAVYEKVSAQFTPEELANLTAVIVTINGWNRIAVGFRFLPDVG